MPHGRRGSHNRHRREARRRSAMARQAEYDALTITEKRQRAREGSNEERKLERQEKKDG